MHWFEARLAENWPPAAWQEITVGVAVSGGADSVALLRALAALRTAGAGRLVVLHFNHQLRGDASDGDARFVTELAAGLGLQCMQEQGDAAALAKLRGDGLEEAARAQRLTFFQRAAEQAGARYVAVAHTADDNAETILHRILRGVGVAGLAGIPRARPLGPAVSLLRPLLMTRRADARAYLSALGQEYRHDASNDDLRLTRNRLRHDLIPKLAAEYNPQVVEALLRLGELAAASADWISRQGRTLLERASSTSAGRWTLDCRVLAGAPAPLLHAAFLELWNEMSWPRRDMSEAQWQRLVELTAAPQAAAGPRKIVLPGNVLAERAGDALLIQRRPMA